MPKIEKFLDYALFAREFLLQARNIPKRDKGMDDVNIEEVLLKDLAKIPVLPYGSDIT
jgi:hypothetical protein